MDFIKNLENWTAGEINQGRLMFVLGMLLMYGVYFMWKTSNELLNGMLAPTILSLVLLIGYGLFMQTDRKAKNLELLSLYENDQDQVVNDFVVKLQKDLSNFKITIPIFIGIILVGIGIFYFTKSHYVNGIGLGVLIFGVIGLFTDTFMLNRAMVLLGFII